MPFITRSGSVSVRGFGKTGVEKYSFSITSDKVNANLRSLAVADGWNQVDLLEVVINSGVYVYSNSTSTAAMTISGSFPAGVLLINNGYIIGMGGAGGKGRDGPYWPSTTGSGTAGAPGGDSLSVSSNVTIVNNGTISGGGGGGGGGGAARSSGAYLGNWDQSAAGGGGGGGRGGKTNSGGGSAGNNTISYFGSEDGPFPYTAATSGTGGTYTAAGSGGTRGTSAGIAGGNGGAGGNWGAAGGNGANNASGTSGGGGLSGGAAGKYASGNNYITWKVEGTRSGGVS